MKKLKSKDFPVFNAYVILFIITLIFGGLALFTKNEKSVRKNDVEDYKTNWITDKGKNADFDNLTNVKYIYKTIDVEKNVTMLYSIRNAVTKVYIDDELIIEDVVSNEFLFGKTRGTVINHINIDEDDNGKTLKIELKTPTSKKVVMTEMLIGDGFDISKRGVTNKILPLGISISITSIGLLLFMCFINLRRKNLVGAEVLYLALFSVSLGMFLILDNKLYPILIGYEAAFHAFAELEMMMIAIPLLLYMGRVYEVKNKKIIYAGCWISFIVSIVSIVLNVLCIKDFSETVIFTQGTYFLTVLIFVQTSYKYIKNTKDKNLFHFLAIASVSIGCILDIITLYVATSISTSNFTEIGVLLFLIFECSDIIQIQIEAYQESTKTEMLSKLAYHDGLTDLYNRTSYLEDLEQIKNNKTDSIICMFDVNNLKTVNDTIGHQAGDELIKTAASVIEESFKDYGKTYRIGGDEFVVIITNNTSKTIFTYQVSVMNKILDDYNKKNNNPYIVSIAYGADVYKGKGKKTIEQVIENADQNMYKKKQEIKSAKKK